MSERKSAEEWRLHCEEQKHVPGRPRWYDPRRPTLCLECACAYARQVGEAVREEGARIAHAVLHRIHIEGLVGVNTDIKHWSECNFCGRQIATAIRQLEIKTP